MEDCSEKDGREGKDNDDLDCGSKSEEEEEEDEEVDVEGDVEEKKEEGNNLVPPPGKRGRRRRGRPPTKFAVGAGRGAKAKGAPRGRPPRNSKSARGRHHSSQSSRLPDSALEGLHPDLIFELNHAFMIYKALQGVSNIDHFKTAPDSIYFGMGDYHQVVSKPIWLDEIGRKLHDQEYTGIADFVGEVRLMIQNCFLFWGEDHSLGKKAKQLQAKLDSNIKKLPELLQGILLSTVSSCDKKSPSSSSVPETDKSSMPAADVPSESGTLPSEPSQNNVEGKLNHDPEKCKLWEKEYLVAGGEEIIIKKLWQLPAIGLFLKVAHDALEVKDIPQYELERMMLMPKESTTLATLLTSMLCPQDYRSRLGGNVPIMPYEVWNKKLKEKVADWFCIFNEFNSDQSEVFNRCGIDISFWSLLCLSNPYESKYFHELTFEERVWIIKALCDNLYHSEKNIQDTFLNLSAEFFDISQLGVFNTYNFLYFNFESDLRIYKHKQIAVEQWESVQPAGITTKIMFEKSISPSFSDDQKQFVEDFSLIADSYEDLMALIETGDYTCTSLERNMLKVCRIFVNHTPNQEGVMKLYDQWHIYNKRPSDYWINLENQWESYFESIASSNSESKSAGPEEPLVCSGKRKRKQVCPNANMEQSSESEEDFLSCDDDAGSDWECPSEKKKPKKLRKYLFEMDDSEENENKPDLIRKAQLKKKRPKKQIAVPQVDNSEKNKLSLVIKSVQSFSNSTQTQFLKPDRDLFEATPATTLEESKSAEPTTEEVVIKQEPVFQADESTLSNTAEHLDLNIVKKEEPLDFQVEASNEANSSDMNLQQVVPTKSSDVKASPVKAGIKDDDVISLSSSDDDDVIMTTPLKEAIKVFENLTKTQESSVKTTSSEKMPNQQGPLPPNTPGRITVRGDLMARPANQAPLIRNLGLIPSPNSPTRLPVPQMRSPLSNNSPVMPFAKRSPSNPLRPGVSRLSPLGPPRTPLARSPRTPTLSPVSPQCRTPSPIRRPPVVNRRLFTSPQNSGTQGPQPRGPTHSVTSLPSKLTIGRRDDGSYGYLAHLPDGGIINLTTSEVDEIRRKHNGAIPPIVNLPLVRPKFRL